MRHISPWFTPLNSPGQQQVQKDAEEYQCDQLLKGLREGPYCKSAYHSYIHIFKFGIYFCLTPLHTLEAFMAEGLESIYPNRPTA